MNARPKPAAFFDRDGTLNVDFHFTHDPRQLVLVEGAAETIAACNALGFHTVIISNQSGIARGYFTSYEVDLFNAALRNDLASRDARIDLVLYCPHHPDVTGPCTCRKPNIGMIKTACARLNIDLRRSFLVGDRKSDMECAQAAGITGVHYQSGSLLTTCRRAGVLPTK